MGPTKPPNGISLVINTIAMIGTCANHLGATPALRPQDRQRASGVAMAPPGGLATKCPGVSATVPRPTPQWPLGCASLLRVEHATGPCTQAALAKPLWCTKVQGKKHLAHPLATPTPHPGLGPIGTALARLAAGAPAGAIVHLGGSRVAAQSKHVSEQKLR